MFLSPHPGIDATPSEVITYFGFTLGVLVIYLLIYCGVPYVLESIAYYRMAQLRKISHPWLAWIPIGRGWILGSISDHYQEKAKMKVTNRRKWLLILGIVALVIGIACAVSFWTVEIRYIQEMGADITDMSSDAAAMTENKTISATLASSILRMFVFLLITCIAAIMLSVFRLIAVYDMFQSCDPSSAIWFFIISILLPIIINGLAFVPSILVFISRFKTYGIPSKPPEGWKSPEEQDWQKPEQIDWQHNRPDDPWKL